MFLLYDRNIDILWEVPTFGCFIISKNIFFSPGGMHGHERRKRILDAVIINEMHAAQTSP
jgi:hypothetical protein